MAHAFHTSTREVEVAGSLSSRPATNGIFETSLRNDLQRRLGNIRRGSRGDEEA